MTKERLEIMRDVPSSEYGGCSFCTERPDTVTLVSGIHPARHGCFRLCAACASELVATLHSEPKVIQPPYNFSMECIGCHRRILLKLARGSLVHSFDCPCGITTPFVPPAQLNREAKS